MIKRILLILLILILAASFFYFDLNQLLTLDGLKGSMAQFNDYKAQSPLLIIGGFFYFISSSPPYPYRVPLF
ncbi:hypothetical protein [Psychrobacter sp. WY6]|uniref:hypothetical protein n=1 Tax=Psychrobacter sp. WY6 TaxID=2708350 RepID=UPI002022E5CA|nr:hypothetical protein [Psychrobacter sp. WY6]